MIRYAIRLFSGSVILFNIATGEGAWLTFWVAAALAMLALTTWGEWADARLIEEQRKAISLRDVEIVILHEFKQGVIDARGKRETP